MFDIFTIYEVQGVKMKQPVGRGSGIWSSIPVKALQRARLTVIGQRTMIYMDLVLSNG